MQIRINGELQDVADGISAAALIEHLGYAGQRVAIEINGEVVPRGRWPETRLRPGDRAELVRAIGGG
jgi:sulfur carrier protein